MQGQQMGNDKYSLSDQKSSKNGKMSSKQNSTDIRGPTGNLVNMPASLTS
jgi:hypothetical protein